ncbi:MAG TPA: hypothetical protein VJ874_04705, partial [Candidatus Thermoplasmatota archaeon]|nr:hypothetical protein [Candidatus Thermoplasmatota archaeon]
MTPTASGPTATATTGAAIAKGDRVLAFDVGSGERHLLVLDGTGTRKHKGLGILDPDRWAGQPWG